MQLSVRDLYIFAVENGLADATIRVCDGMAVNYFITRSCVGVAPMEIVLDVSAEEPCDYEDLPDASKRVAYDVFRIR